jgi:hypothetical protein
MSKIPKFRHYGMEQKKSRFVIFHHEILTSPAFMSLSCQAVRVLILLKMRFNGSNNGDISLSCREIARLGNMALNTAKRAFNELEEKGFIKLAVLGSIITCKSSTWLLTTDKNNTETKSTDEWRNWGKGTVKNNF